MDELSIVSERTRVRRRALALDEHYRIVHSQSGSRVDDLVFGFDFKSERLPANLEQLIRSMTEGWDDGRDACVEARLLAPNGIAVRVFPMFERGARKIGVVLERPRRRKGDSQG